MDFFSDLLPYFDPRVLLADNEFAQGAMLAGLLAWAGYQLRALPQKAGALVKRRFTAKLEVRDPEPFDALAYHLSTLDYATEGCRRLAVSVDADRAYDDGPRRVGESAPMGSLVFAPARGLHVFWDGRWPYWLTRETEGQEAGADQKKGFMQREYFVLNTLGGDAGRLRSFMERAYGAFRARERPTVDVFTLASWDWVRLKDAAPRPLDSVVLAPGLKEEIVADLSRFLSLRQAYAERGVPYRRGYLVEGVPGTGKSSLARALAHHFGLNLYVLSLKGRGLDDGDLIQRMQAVRPGSIVLMEDVDCVVPDRETEDGVTLAGLLNAVDGVAAPEHVVFFYSTNDASGLDSALLRKGRIDRRYTLGPAGPEQVAALAKRACPDVSAEAVAALFGGVEVPPCDVQDALGVEPITAGECLSRLRALVTAVPVE